MRKLPLIPTILVLVVIGLAANNLRQHYLINSLTNTTSQQYRSMMYLQVQFMDRGIEINRSQDAGLLLTDPDSWFDPFKKSINSNPKKIDLLKRIAFPSSDETGSECYMVYCNPINDDIEPCEVFYFYFQGEKCSEIRRKALSPW
jgi:hypothetical protein